jgi:putative phosphoribosyl transferase
LIPVYRDRQHAGLVLADHLVSYARSRAVVLAIPNGGVAVAAPLAATLKLALDLIIVRKIPLPGTTEAGFGSVASDGTVFLNQSLLRRLRLSREEIDAGARKVLAEIRQRMERYGVKGNYEAVRGCAAIVVDDGLASGITMEAAVYTVNQYDPSEILVAAPTASAQAVERISPLVNRIICPNIREGPYFAVAEAYENWYDLEPEEVISLLEEVKASRQGRSDPSQRATRG